MVVLYVATSAYTASLEYLAGLIDFPITEYALPEFDLGKASPPLLLFLHRFL